MASTGRIRNDCQLRRRDVRQQAPARLQHRFDIRQGERLIEYVVVDEHVRGNDEIERLRVEAIGHDVHVQHRNAANGGRPYADGAHVGQIGDRLRRRHRRGRTDSIAEASASSVRTSGSHDTLLDNGRFNV